MIKEATQSTLKRSMTVKSAYDYTLRSNSNLSILFGLLDLGPTRPKIAKTVVPFDVPFVVSSLSAQLA